MSNFARSPHKVYLLDQEWDALNEEKRRTGLKTVEEVLGPVLQAWIQTKPHLKLRAEIFARHDKEAEAEYRAKLDGEIPGAVNERKPGDAV